MAVEYKQLFVDFLKVNNEQTRQVSCKCLFDISLVHPSVCSAADIRSCVGLLVGEDGNDAVLSTAVEGFCKSLLHDRITDQSLANDVLLGLLILFYHPIKSDDRTCQCLSFFFHAYSFTSPVRQHRIRLLIVPCLEALVGTTANLTIIHDQLLYLTDPNQLYTENQDPVDWSEVMLGLLFAAVRFPREAQRFYNYAAKLPLQPTDTNSQCIKECSYFCNLLLRHPTTTSAIKKICALLAVADNQQLAVLEKERLEILLKRIEQVAPELLTLPTSTTQGKRAPQKRVVQVENVMDNLQDILE